MTIPNNGIGIFKIPDSDIVSTLFSLFAPQIEGTSLGISSSVASHTVSVFSGRYKMEIVVPSEHSDWRTALISVIFSVASHSLIFFSREDETLASKKILILVLTIVLFIY